jgi:hypothetical protein
VHPGVQRLDQKLSGRVDRMEANLTQQIDGIDKRLDAIEFQKLPMRVAKLEHMVKAV